MSGARGLGTDEARFTPITVAGIVAIIGLSGVLIGSVLQDGGGSRSTGTRLASAAASSRTAQAGTVSPLSQAAVLPAPTSSPVISTASAPAAGGSDVAVASQGVVSTGTTAPTQASGSSQAAASIAAAVRPATVTQVLPAAASQSASAQAPGAQFTTNVARAAAGSGASVGSSPTGASGAAVVSPASPVAALSTFAGPSDVAGADDSVPGDGSNSGGLSVPPGQDIQQVIGGAPGWGDFQDVWTPAMTGTGQWIIGPGGTAPPDADPAKTIYLKPGEGAENVNGTYVVYEGTGGVPGTLGYAP